MLSRKIDAGSSHTRSHVSRSLPIPFEAITQSICSRVSYGKVAITNSHSPTSQAVTCQDLFGTCETRKIIIKRKSSVYKANECAPTVPHTRRMPIRTKYDGLQHFYQRRALIQPGSIVRCNTHITTLARRPYTFGHYYRFQ